jgi:hypothetical protein
MTKKYAFISLWAQIWPKTKIWFKYAFIWPIKTAFSCSKQSEKCLYLIRNVKRCQDKNMTCHRNPSPSNNSVISEVITVTLNCCTSYGWPKISHIKCRLCIEVKFFKYYKVIHCLEWLTARTKSNSYYRILCYIFCFWMYHAVIEHSMFYILLNIYHIRNVSGNSLQPQLDIIFTLMWHMLQF